MEVDDEAYVSYRLTPEEIQRVMKHADETRSSWRLVDRFRAALIDKGYDVGEGESSIEHKLELHELKEEAPKHIANSKLSDEIKVEMWTKYKQARDTPDNMRNSGYRPF